MRAVFGVVGLLVALAIVGIVAKKQLQATGVSAGPLAPAASAGTVAQQSRQVQQQIQADVTKALEQGAATRQDETDK
jgi:hypothetical protein